MPVSPTTKIKLSEQERIRYDGHDYWVCDLDALKRGLQEFYNTEARANNVFGEAYCSAEKEMREFAVMIESAFDKAGFGDSYSVKFEDCGSSLYVTVEDIRNLKTIFKWRVSDHDQLTSGIFGCYKPDLCHSVASFASDHESVRHLMVISRPDAYYGEVGDYADFDDHRDTLTAFKEAIDPDLWAKLLASGELRHP